MEIKLFISVLDTFTSGKRKKKRGKNRRVRKKTNFHFEIPYKNHLFPLDINYNTNLYGNHQKKRQICIVRMDEIGKSE